MSLIAGIKNYFKCDESSGNITDSVGGIILTNNGTTPFATGIINNGLDFGTANSSKHFEYTGTNLYNGGAFTVNLWVKIRTEPTSGTNQIFFVAVDSVTSTYPIIMYRNSAGTLQTYMGRCRYNVADDVVIANNTLGTANWHMLTVTYDGVTVRSYVDGSSSGTPVTSSGNGTGAPTNTHVGSWITGGDWALSYEDEIGLWWRALSSGEITTLYNSGNAKALYTFDTTTDLIDSYSESNQDSTNRFNSATLIRYGQCFTVSSYFILDSCKFYMARVLNPSGNLTAKIFAMSGTFGSTGIGTGNALATSDNVSIAGISTSVSLVTFTFSGSNKMFLPLGHYVIVAECDNQTVDASNYITFYIDTTSPSHTGNKVNYTTGAGWTSDNTQDAIFYVYGNLIENYPSNTQPFLRVGGGMGRNERAT